MDDKVPKVMDSDAIVQSWLSALESGHPEQQFAIISLVDLAKRELYGLRMIGTAGTMPYSPSIVSAFLKVLSQDNDPKIRVIVAKEMGKIAHDIVRYEINVFQDIPKLVEQGLISAIEDESPRVQKAAIKYGTKYKANPGLLASTWFDLGVDYQQMVMIDKAITTNEKSLHYNPHYIQTGINLDHIKQFTHRRDTL